MPRKQQIQPDFKVCTACKHDKPISAFRVDPTPSNPNWRRNQCDDCRNTLTRTRLKNNGTHKKRYANMTEEERKVYIKHKSEQNQIRFKTKPEALAKKKLHDKSDRGIYSRYKGDCNRRGKLERGITMDLNFDQFQELINSPCKFCALPNCRGVDRIDSSRSYTVDNSQPCCETCNTMKSDLTQHEFISHLKAILANQ